MFDKEAIYDEKISPLMREIIEICKQDDIPMVMQFYLKEQHPENPDNPMYCTSFVIPAKKDMNPEAYDHLKYVTEAMKYGREGKPFVMACTITGKEA